MTEDDGIPVEAEDLMQEKHPGAVSFCNGLLPGRNCGARSFRIVTDKFINVSHRESTWEYNIHAARGSGYKSGRPGSLDFPDEFRTALVSGDTQDLSYPRIVEITNFKTGSGRSPFLRVRNWLQAGPWKWAVPDSHAPEGYISEQS